MVTLHVYIFIYLFHKNDEHFYKEKNIKACYSTTQVQNMYKVFNRKVYKSNTSTKKKHRKKKEKKDIEQIERYSTRTIKITNFTI